MTRRVRVNAGLAEHVDPAAVRGMAGRSGFAWPAWGHGTFEEDGEAGVPQWGHADGLPAVVALAIEQHHRRRLALRRPGRRELGKRHDQVLPVGHDAHSNP